MNKRTILPLRALGKSRNGRSYSDSSERDCRLRLIGERNIAPDGIMVRVFDGIVHRASGRFQVFTDQNIVNPEIEFILVV